jgi:hypothetical protein
MFDDLPFVYTKKIALAGFPVTVTGMESAFPSKAYWIVLGAESRRSVGLNGAANEESAKRKRERIATAAWRFIVPSRNRITCSIERSPRNVFIINIFIKTFHEILFLYTQPYNTRRNFPCHKVSRLVRALSTTWG